MAISFRSCLTPGVAIITAAAIAFGPSVQEPTPAAPPSPVVHIASPPVELAASVSVTALPNLLLGLVQKVVVPPSASQPFPAPPSGPGPAPQSIPGTLEWAYHAVEPWVRYGFELATYAVGWVPYVGWLSGQIMIFYNFGERIVHAIVHNTLDWLSGNGSFLQNLGEGIAWSIDALIQLGIDEWNYFLPPLPPLPPFPFAATAATATTESLKTVASTEGAQVNQEADAVTGADEQSTDPADEVVVKAPKKLKVPKEPEATTEVAVESEVGAAQDESTPEPTKVPKRVKKADEGQPTKAATESSGSTEPAGDKHDNTGDKKDDSGTKVKKDEKE